MADTTEQQIVKTEQYSLRQFSPSSFGGIIGGDSLGWLFPSTRDLVGAWGTYECDIALRVMHYQQQNGLWGGALKVWLQKILGTPYEISGGRNLTFQFQDLFFESDFGEGYDYTMTKFLTDYATTNCGGFLEKVAYGASDTPIEPGAQILGINHLDALRIIFTGNREYPYLYQSEWGGGLHKLHYTRVIHLAESPSPNTLMFGMGKCALYDAISTTNAQVLLGRHQNELLSDMPPPGIVIFNNVKPDEVETAMKQFEYERIRDGQNVYRSPLRISSVDPNLPATVTFVPMATVPEDFDYAKYMNIHVNMIALALQLDPQDIWPLQTKSMGSGAQSQILDAKSESKGYGYLLTRLERMWNTGVLPRSLEWKFKAPNAQADMQLATVAKTWSDMLSTNTFLPSQAKMEILADQVPAFADVLLDESGQVRVFDADPKEPTQIIVATPDAVVSPTEAAPAPPTDATTDTTATDNATLAKSKAKGIDGTSADFVDAMAAAMQDGIDRKRTKAASDTYMQALIVKFGRQGMGDGLEYGGVDRSDMSADDVKQIGSIALDNAPFVSDLVDEIYSKEGMRGSPDTRAPMWTKTLVQFYQAGVMSADASGYYQWNFGSTDHCDDCQRLNKQIHRYKDWVASEWMPQSNKLECNGYNCECSLSKVVDGSKSRGNY